MLFTSCANQEVNNNTTSKVRNDSLKSIIINSDDILEVFDPINIIQEIEYIHLELTDENIIGQIDKVLRVDDRIFVLDRSQAKSVLCFRADGKYLFNVGKLGGGVGEYRDLEDIVVDQKAEELGILSRSGIQWYNINNGTYSGNITKFKNILLERISHLDSNSFIGYANNQCGSKNDCFNFYRITKDGEVLSSYLPIDKNEKNLFIAYENPFSGDVRTKSLTHLFNDTIYNVTNDGELYGKYHINFGDMALENRSLLPRKTKDLSKWMSESDKKGLVAGLEFFAENDSIMVFNFLKGSKFMTTFLSKHSGKSITTKDINSPGTLLGGIIKGVYNNHFISSFSGEVLMQLQAAFEAHEDKGEIKEIYSKALYDYIMSLEGSANPTLVFTRYQSF